MLARTRIALLTAAFTALSIPASSAPPLVPRGPEFRVSANPRLSHYSPSIAAFPDGGFVVVWASSFPDYRARLLDAQGRPTGFDIRLPVEGVSHVAADRDGFAVVWAGFPPSSTHSTLYLRRFGRDGRPRSKRIRLDLPIAKDRFRPLITFGADGRFAIAWQQDAFDPEGGIYSNAVARIFAAQGTPLTPDLLLHAGDAASPAGDDAISAFPSGLALRPDGILAALVQDEEGGDCIRSYLAQVAPDGTRLPLQPLSGHSCGIADLSGEGGSLAMGRDGSLVAAWSQYEIEAWRFAPDGTPRGDAFSASQDTPNDQRNPAVALQAGGSFVITWMEDGRDGDGRGIFGRSFAANGTPRTQDFQINTTAQGDQSLPAIAAPRQGPAVVVWTEQRLHGGPTEVLARVLAPRR